MRSLLVAEIVLQNNASKHVSMNHTVQISTLPGMAQIQNLCSIQSVPDSGNKHDVRWIDHDLGCPVPDAQR